jgi:hypothetical protein
MPGKWSGWQEIDTRPGAAAINVLILRSNSAEAAPLVRERSRVQSSPTAPSFQILSADIFAANRNRMALKGMNKNGTVASF